MTYRWPGALRPAIITRRISEWQLGGSARQTKKRGERLKELSEAIDSRFPS